MSTVVASMVPMYQQGFGPVRHARRFSNLSAAPRIPLHQLGWMGDAAKIIGTVAPLAAKITTTALTSAVNAGALTIASAAIPIIGAGVAVVMAVIAGLWSAHEARAKGAKDENTAVNSALIAFDGGLQAIFAAANSSDPAQNISASQAAQLCQQQLQTFWQSMAPHMTGPGRADTSGFGANCGTVNPSSPCSGMIGGHVCDKSCTASCCVGCQDLAPTIEQAVAVFSSPNGGSVTACAVAGSKYGASARGSYTLTYKPPTLTGASGILSSLTSGGNGSLLPLALAAVVAWMVLR